MTAQRFKQSTALLIAEFFGCGRIPHAPGTMGSLASLLIWIPSVTFAWPLWVKLALLLFIFIIGLWASDYGIAHYHCIDPKQVVIDEVVGQGIPFLLLEPSWMQFLLAFVLFRFFDIVKPWPIKAIEQQFPDRWGIMLDDVAAGIMAMAVIFIGKALL